MIFTLKQAKLHAGLTQDKLANKLGISRWTYAKLERDPNETTIKQAKKISKITGVSYNDIFFA